MTDTPWKLNWRKSETHGLLDDPSPRVIRHTIISVDDHVIEPATVWSDRLPKKYLDVGPRVVDRPLRSLSYVGGVLAWEEGEPGDVSALFGGAGVRGWASPTSPRKWIASSNSGPAWWNPSPTSAARPRTRPSWRAAWTFLLWWVRVRRATSFARTIGW